MILNAYDAHEIYMSHFGKPYMKKYADTVGRFQEGFLAEGVCADLDTSFARAVETTERLLPAIKAMHQK